MGTAPRDVGRVGRSMNIRNTDFETSRFARGYRTDMLRLRTNASEMLQNETKRCQAGYGANRTAA